jgi:3-oxoacyl-[acyl-carrier protein] reductase
MSEADLSVVHRQFEIMVMSVMDITARFLPGMRAQGWGRVLTVASSGVIQPIPNLGLSNALRSTLVGWSKSMANETAGDGVTFNMLLPGRIDTERLKELDAANAKRSGKEPGGGCQGGPGPDPGRPLRQGRRIRQYRRVPGQRAGELHQRIDDPL